MNLLDAQLAAGVRMNAAEFAREHGVSQRTVYRHQARTRAEGLWRPHSRRPHHSPRATPPDLDTWIRKLRADLVPDNGADFIRDALADLHRDTRPGWPVPSRSTINRVLARHDLLDRNPAKRPRGSWRRVWSARVAELLAGPGPAPTLLLREPRPTTAAGFAGDEIRAVLRTDITTGASLGRRAAVHLLSSTSIPDQPGFGGLVAILDLPWDMGDTMRMGQVEDWAAVVAFAESADVPARDRQLIALAASLAGGPPVRLAANVTFTGDPAAAQRVIEAIAIATGHGDRWRFTEKPAQPTRR